MKHSIMEKWIELLRAWQSGDIPALKALLASQPEVSWVGPGTEALWLGRVAVLQNLPAIIAERLNQPLETYQLEVRTGADWAWVFYVGTAGSTLLRVSTFWMLEADSWRLLAWHADTGEHRQPAGEMTGARQAMSNWARLIESPLQVPLAYQDALKVRLDARAPFPYMVLIPAFADKGLRVPEQLVFEQDGVLYILAREDRGITASAYRLSDVCSVESGLVLLVSWFTLEGWTTGDVWQTTTLAFNSASRMVVWPLLQRLRSFGPSVPKAAAPAPPTDLPDKFLHHLRDILLPDEEVMAWLWRPDITLDMALVSQWAFYEAQRVNHLTLLTDRALILVWDRVSEAGAEDEEGYGTVLHHIPLVHITDLQIREDPGGMPYLQLTLCNKVTVERLFTTNQRIELEELARAIQAARYALNPSAA